MSGGVAPQLVQARMLRFDGVGAQSATRAMRREPRASADGLSEMIRMARREKNPIVFV